MKFEVIQQGCHPPSFSNPKECFARCSSFFWGGGVVVTITTKEGHAVPMCIFKLAISANYFPQRLVQLFSISFH